MPQTAQTFKNHTRLLPPFHFFVLPVLLINFLNEIRHVVQEPSRHLRGRSSWRRHFSPWPFSPGPWR